MTRSVDSEPEIVSYVKNLGILLDSNESIEAVDTGDGYVYSLVVFRGNKVVMNHTIERHEYNTLKRFDLLKVEPEQFYRIVAYA